MCGSIYSTRRIRVPIYRLTGPRESQRASDFSAASTDSDNSRFLLFFRHPVWRYNTLSWQLVARPRGYLSWLVPLIYDRVHFIFAYDDNNVVCITVDAKGFVVRERLVKVQYMRKKYSYIYICKFEPISASLKLRGALRTRTLM